MFDKSIDYVNNHDRQAVSHDIDANQGQLQGKRPEDFFVSHHELRTETGGHFYYDKEWISTLKFIP